MSFSYEEPTLQQAERVLGLFYGKRKEWGGKLIITNRRLLFAKLDLGPIPDILEYVGGQAGVPGIELGKKVLDQIGGSVDLDVPLEHISSVEPDGKAGVFGGPKVQVTTATGQVIKTVIVKSQTSFIWNGESNDVRDRAVAILREAVQAARSAATLSVEPRGRAR